MATIDELDLHTGSDDAGAVHTQWLKGLLAYGRRRANFEENIGKGEHDQFEEEIWKTRATPNFFGDAEAASAEASAYPKSTTWKQICFSALNHNSI